VHSMTYAPPSGVMIAPLSQTCPENAAREVELRTRLRRLGASPLVSSRCPGSDGNVAEISGGMTSSTLEEVDLEL